MAKIRNVSGVALIVPGLGGRRVEPKQIVDVPDEELLSYTCQVETWAPSGKASTELHEKLAADDDERVAEAMNAARGYEGPGDDTEEPEPEPDDDGGNPPSNPDDNQEG